MTVCSILSTLVALLLLAATTTNTAVVEAFSNNDFGVALLSPSPSQRRVVVNNGVCYRREYYFHGEYNIFCCNFILLNRVCSWLLTAALLHVV